MPAQVTNQPVTRAGLGRNLDRDAEQPLPAGHEQRAEPEHPGGERGRNRGFLDVPFTASAAASGTPLASSV